MVKTLSRVTPQTHVAISGHMMISTDDGIVTTTHAIYNHLHAAKETIHTVRHRSSYQAGYECSGDNDESRRGNTS